MLKILEEYKLTKYKEILDIFCDMLLCFCDVGRLCACESALRATILHYSTRCYEQTRPSLRFRRVPRSQTVPSCHRSFNLAVPGVPMQVRGEASRRAPLHLRHPWPPRCRRTHTPTLHPRPERGRTPQRDKVSDRSWRRASYRLTANRPFLWALAAWQAPVAPEHAACSRCSAQGETFRGATRGSDQPPCRRSSFHSPLTWSECVCLGWSGSRCCPCCSACAPCTSWASTCSWAASCWCGWRWTGPAAAGTCCSPAGSRRTSAGSGRASAGRCCSSSTRWRSTSPGSTPATRRPDPTRTSCRCWRRPPRPGPLTAACTPSGPTRRPPPCRGSRASPPAPCPRLWMLVTTLRPPPSWRTTSSTSWGKWVSTSTREESTYTREESTYTREESTYTREVRTYTREVSTCTREERTCTREVSTYTREVTAYTR